jgi:lipoprotein-anchoring transpeptidase ErfK/SrfK
MASRPTYSYRTRRVRKNRLGPVALAFLVAGSVALGWWLSRGEQGPQSELPPLSSRLPEEAFRGEEPNGIEPEIAAPTTEAQQQELRGARERFAALEAARVSGEMKALKATLADVILSEEPTAEERDALVQELMLVNEKSLLDPAAHDGFIQETVGRGETYTHIARRLRTAFDVRVSTGLLQALNGIEPKRLRPNQVLKCPKESPWILVDKSHFRLYVVVPPQIGWVFPVGIGRDGRTPEGEFTIVGKTVNPDWRDPRSGKLIKFGAEGHLVGTRWLGFQDSNGPTHFGIHGTVQPDSVGQAMSDGCVRMRNEDVERLFDLIPEGARVVVRP